MNRTLAGIALLLLAGTADAQRPPRVEPAKFGWHTDYNAAKTEAKRSGKPMMLVFRCEP